MAKQFCMIDLIGAFFEMLLCFREMTVQSLRQIHGTSNFVELPFSFEALSDFSFSFIYGSTDSLNYAGWFSWSIVQISFPFPKIYGPTAARKSFDFHFCDEFHLNYPSICFIAGLIESFSYGNFLNCNVCDTVWSIFWELWSKFCFTCMCFPF